MPASVSGSKTVLNSVSPQGTAAALTTLLAIAPENMTVLQLNQLIDAMNRVSGGDAPGAVVGSVLI